MDTSTSAARILLKNKDEITMHFRAGGNPLSAASFPNIFIWQDFFDFTCETIDHSLLIFAANEVGCFLYAPPAAKAISETAIQEAFSRMRERNRGSAVSRVENVPSKDLDKFRKYVTREKSPDYLYRREDIAQLKGNAYKTHRWSYNYFVENNSAEFLPYEDQMQEECRALYRRWAEERAGRCDDPVYRQMLEDNAKVHQRILHHHKEIDLIGRVIKIKGRICGYTFGFSLNEETFCILCEIIDLSIKGAAVFIFREFCRDGGLRNFSFINAMDDSDMPNIRRVKESFHPVQLIKNYVITEK